MTASTRYCVDGSLAELNRHLVSATVSNLHPRASQWWNQSGSNLAITRVVDVAIIDPPRPLVRGSYDRRRRKPALAGVDVVRHGSTGSNGTVVGISPLRATFAQPDWGGFFTDKQQQTRTPPSEATQAEKERARRHSFIPPGGYTRLDGQTKARTRRPCGKE
ncbi:hypothetical protein GQ600_11652 [Phytophthora cactorum]|nr:hypothetical protein GQ600_11652 [Phytophthora cactorum]